MTQDEIIEMAKHAGASPDGKLWLMYSVDLVRFAKLVAAKEREACMELCEDADSYYATRARGEA